MAVLDSRGKILEKIKLPTPKNYDNFLLELRHWRAHLDTKHDFRAAGVAIPGRIDRQHGRAIRLGNLHWKNEAVQADIEHIFHCPAVVENDAKLAGLAEAILLKKEYATVLYVTVSTGVGYALIQDGAIDVSIGDGGGRAIRLEHGGKLVAWEDFASGRAIVERFGKRASDITDAHTWEIISRDLAQGLIQLIAIMQPEVIVIGGSVGSYFERYHKPLAAALKKYDLPMVTLPVLRQAAHAEEAVVYGCYELAKQHYGHGNVTR